MTDIEINIAIAEFCGWTRTVDGMSWVSPVGSRYARWKQQDFDSVSISDAQILPSYSTDLNAMHEAEEKIPADLEFQWSLQLAAACLGWTLAQAYNARIDLPRLIKMFKATARQRAEALLRTIGKWKE